MPESGEGEGSPKGAPQVSGPTVKKAKKLLSEGRVRSLGTGGRGIYFSVEGETETHQVSFEPAKGRWSCDCKYVSLYPKRECSHIIASRLFSKNSESMA